MTAQVVDVLTYPNPATSSTGATLKYSVSSPSGVSASRVHAAGTSDAVSIPVSGKIRIGIYAVSGRLIWQKTLDDASFISVGEHAVRWDGKTAGGQNLAAGTYILKVSLLSNSGASSGYSTIIMLR
jgi:flagellar hook assembly protein FlgD